MQNDSDTVRHPAYSRRDTMRLFGIAGLGALLGSAASAGAKDVSNATAADLQGAGFYRRRIGQAEVVLLSDGGFPMDPVALFGEVPSHEMEAARRSAFHTAATVPGHVNALMVCEGSNVILIDTGCGSLFGPATGFLSRNLTRAGVSANDVTHVILTHAHPDHIGGLVGADEKLAFPKARIVINRAEHDFWTQPAPTMSKSRAPAEMQAMVIDVAKRVFAIAQPKVELVKPCDKVGAAITIVDAAGHTPGHVALGIESGGESMIYVTDAVHIPSLQLANPGWHVLYDADPEQAVETRRMILAKAAAERMIIAGAHIPFPATGNLVADGEGYRFVPAIWEW